MLTDAPFKRVAVEATVAVVLGCAVVVRAASLDVELETEGFVEMG